MQTILYFGSIILSELGGDARLFVAAGVLREDHDPVLWRRIPRVLCPLSFEIRITDADGVAVGDQ